MNISSPKNVSLPCKGTVIAVEIAHGCFSVVAISAFSRTSSLCTTYAQALQLFIWDLMRHPTTVFKDHKKNDSTKQ